MEGKSGDRRKKYPVSGLEQHRGKWRWRPTIDGKRHLIPLAAVTEAAAIAEVTELRQRRLATIISPWKEAVGAYLRTRRGNGRLSETTAENRRPLLEAVGKLLDLPSPRSLTPALVQRWLRLLATATDEKPALSESTISDYFRHLRAFCKWAVLNGRMSTDPTAAIEIAVTQAKTRDVFLPASRVAELLQAARDSGNRDMEFILALGFECGMRRGEIAACRPEWFDLRSGVVVIPHTDQLEGDEKTWKRKGQEGRRREAVVPLSTVMLEIIGRHTLPSPFVIAPKKPWGKHRYRFEYRKRFAAFMASHDAGHITVHDMRRSFASNRVSAGVSIEKIANWMGITRDVAWKNYSRFMPGDQEINRGSAAPQQKVSTAAATPTDLEGKLARIDELAARGIICDGERATLRAQILSSLTS